MCLSGLFLILIAPSNITLYIERARLIHVFQGSANGLGFLRKYKWAALTRNYLFTQPSKWTVHSRKHGLNICHIFAG